MNDDILNFTQFMSSPQPPNVGETEYAKKLSYFLRAFLILSEEPNTMPKELAKKAGTPSEGYAADLRCFFNNGGGTLRGMRLSCKHRGHIPTGAWPAE